MSACSLILFSFVSVTNQRYEINISPESIIVGNDAIFKCSIPSFVSDFVQVDSWIDSEANALGSTFLGKLLMKVISCIVETNRAALKIKSFNTCRFLFYFVFSSVTSQRYEIDILRESVIVGNDAIFKCSIPSFVSDFVFVDNWVDSEANILGSSSIHFGKYYGEG